jgi:hypothetical protein
MLDVPDATPVKQRCDSCGFPADVALVMPDGDVATACRRHRIDLPAVPDGTRRVERRFGRWYGGRVSVEQLVGSTLYLECEACGVPGSVVYELRTPEACWQTVACRACLPATVAVHGGVIMRALATRDAVPLEWRSVPDTWWPPASAGRTAGRTAGRSAGRSTGAAAGRTYTRRDTRQTRRP